MIDAQSKSATSAGSSASRAGSSGAANASSAQASQPTIRRLIRDDQICVLTFDRPGSSANIFDSRTLAELTRGTAVTVNAVVPGSTRTEGVRIFVQGLFPELPYEEAKRRFVAENRSTSIIARLIDPAEVADFVAFVCSQRASAINGAALRVDGGIVRSIY